ncbi:MAG: DnaD domain protein [Bacilli bacterium]|nr:DnaD domain protein [Bacilli bacterium]
MLILKEIDYLEVKLNSLVADYDRMIVTNLYQPIIGHTAVALYFTLLTEAENQKINAIISHKTIFNRMVINANEFLSARHKLEATGLLKTFVSDLRDNKLYEYLIFAPKTPKLFFDNTLLYGMLMKNVGEPEALKIKSLYNLDIQPTGKEVTSSFSEIYAPDFDDPIFRKAIESSSDPLFTRQSAKLQSGFSYELFFEYLKNHSQLNEKSISKKEMKEVERIATLYGVKENNAADAVIRFYNPSDKENRIDFESLNNFLREENNYLFLRKGNQERVNGSVSGSTDLASKINLMERTSPKEYLAIKQNGTQPASADLKIISDLSYKFRLPNSVINAVIDYVLVKNDNILSRPLCEKIAGSLARENAKTAYDAMNYLKSISSRGRNRKKIEKVEEVTTPVVENKEETPTYDWDAMIKELEEGNKNGED